MSLNDNFNRDSNNISELKLAPSTLEPYEPPDSLWQLIKSIANERELDVIKSRIGESLVETSIDLHNEIDSLLEIWRDYRNETAYTLEELKNRMNGKSNLPEPPNIRETLKKEIKFFVSQMRQQFAEEDKFCRQIVSNNHNLNVINYVLNSNESSNNKIIKINEDTNDTIRRSRSSSASMLVKRPPSVVNKRTGAETPMLLNLPNDIATGRESRQRIRYRSTSRASSVNSPRPNTIASGRNNLNDLSENLELMVDEDKINCYQIDDVAEHLRELLQQECDTLLKDIEFLYECLDEESNYRTVSKQTLKEPSINELKEERKKLEADLLSSTGKNLAQISKLPSQVSSSNNNRSINSPIMTNRITPSPPSSASSVRSRASVASNTISSRVNAKTTQNGLINKRSTSMKPTNDNGVVSVTTLLSKRATNSPKPLFNKQISQIGRESGDIGRPLMTRTNSVSSIASSIESSSLSSSTSSKQSAVQRFRQMVMESRD